MKIVRLRRALALLFGRFVFGSFEQASKHACTQNVSLPIANIKHDKKHNEFKSALDAQSLRSGDMCTQTGP